MEDLTLASVLHRWQKSEMPHPLYMWGLIDVSKNRIVKFFLFYREVKYNNITRDKSAPAFIKRWVENRRKELKLDPSTKGQFFVKREGQESSQQMKGFFSKISQDFDVTYVDDLTSRGVAWGDSLIETLCDLPTTREEKNLFTKMETLPLSKEDVVSLKKVFVEQVEKFHLKKVAKGVSHLPPLATPDLVIEADDKRVWLNQIGEELGQWVALEDDVMSDKGMREAWREAMKTKNRIATKMAASQETMLKKQDVAIEEIQNLSLIVQSLKDRLERKKNRKGKTKPLRGEITPAVYRALMEAPAPRYTKHAHTEQARKRIVFTLLYYVGPRVNELRRLTHADVINAMQEGKLNLVLHKQGDARERVLPTIGQEEMRNLTNEIDLFFNQRKYKVLGESFKKPGRLMHEKSWISYINNEITKVQRRLKINDVLSSHSFRVGFLTRHLKHTDSHLVSQLVGHKHIATTLKYNRYVVDEKKQREILNKGYTAEGSYTPTNFPLVCNKLGG